jgi:hypothetical protein
MVLTTNICSAFDLGTASTSARSRSAGSAEAPTLVEVALRGMLAGTHELDLPGPSQCPCCPCAQTPFEDKGQDLDVALEVTGDDEGRRKPWSRFGEACILTNAPIIFLIFSRASGAGDSASRPTAYRKLRRRQSRALIPKRLISPTTALCQFRRPLRNFSSSLHGFYTQRMLRE